MICCFVNQFFAKTCQTENPQGFSEVDENKQLLITILSL